MRRLLLAAACLALLPAATARAQVPGIMEPADQEELAQSLADAQAEQGICYGWDVTLNGVHTETGSSVSGPGEPPSREECDRFAVLVADIVWTCDSCEEEDSAYFDIESNLDDVPTRGDLRALGYTDADLIGDQDDVALFEMVGALPLLAAQRGNAEPVAFETPSAVPAADRPEDSPGSDFLRMRWQVLLLCAGLIALGPAFLLYARRHGIGTKEP